MLDLGYLWTERDYEQAGDYFQHAIELAREMGDQSTLAHTLNRVGNWYANREQPHEGLHYHQEALGIFHRLNDQHGLAETLDLLGTTSLAAGLLPSGVTYYEQAIALLRALGDRQLLISSLGMATMRCANYLSDTLIWLPTSGTACIHEAEEAVALARQIDWRSGEAFALTFMGLGLASRGEYSRALTSGQAALDIAVEIEHGLWMTFAHFLLGSLSLDLLALSSARQHFEQALSLAKESGSLFWLRIMRRVVDALRCSHERKKLLCHPVQRVFLGGQELGSQRLTSSWWSRYARSACEPCWVECEAQPIRDKLIYSGFSPTIQNHAPPTVFSSSKREVLTFPVI